MLAMKMNQDVISDEDETQPYMPCDENKQKTQSYPCQSMKYFAPCPEVANAYTAVILQHLKYYHQRLQQVQSLCIPIPWGESVKPGRHQSRTIDQKKRGQQSFYLFDSDDGEFQPTPKKCKIDESGHSVTEDNVFDPATTGIEKDQSLDQSPIFESLKRWKVEETEIQARDTVRNADIDGEHELHESFRKRKVNDTELAEFSKKDNGYKKSEFKNRSSIKRQKTTRCESPNFTNVYNETEYVKSKGHVEDDSDSALSKADSNGANISLGGKPVGDSFFKHKSFQQIIHKNVDRAGNKHDEEQIDVKQQKEMATALRTKDTNQTSDTERYEASESPKFKKKIGHGRKTAVESNLPSDDESVASSTSDSMLNLHGDLFSTQVCCIKDRKQQRKTIDKCVDMDNDFSGSQYRNPMFLFNEKQIIKKKSKIKFQSEINEQIENKFEGMSEGFDPSLNEEKKSDRETREPEKNKLFASEVENARNILSRCAKLRQKKKICTSVKKEVEKKATVDENIIILDSSGSDTDLSRQQTKPISDMDLTSQSRKSRSVTNQAASAQRSDPSFRLQVKQTSDPDFTRQLRTSSSDNNSCQKDLAETLNINFTRHCKTPSLNTDIIHQHRTFQTDSVLGRLNRTPSTDFGLSQQRGTPNITNDLNHRRRTPSADSDSSRQHRTPNITNDLNHRRRTPSADSDLNRQHRTPNITNSLNHGHRDSDFQLETKKKTMQVRSTRRTKTEQQDVQMVPCPLCAQVFQQHEIEEHASECDGIVKMEVEEPADMQQLSPSNLSEETQQHSAGNEQDYLVNMMFGDGPQQSQKSLPGDGSQHFLVDASQNKYQLSQEQSQNSSHQEDSGDPRYQHSSQGHEDMDSCRTDSDREKEKCYVCDGEFWKGEEFSKHFDSCLENAKLMQQEVDRHGFLKLFSEDAEPENARSTRSRSRHRSGERRNSPEF